MTESSGQIASGADGASMARRIYRRSPLRWLHNIWWDHRGLRDTDVFMCSYPRSGSTWLRFLLHAATMGELGSFESIARDLPLVGEHHDAVPVVPGGGRLMKTHEPYNRRYHRVVHIVRDPRDVALSYWTFMQRIGKIVIRPEDDEVASFDHFLDALILGRVDAFTTWQQHLLSYVHAAERHPGDVLLLRFEDMRADTPGTVLAIAEFLGTNVTTEQATRAAGQASVENMRQAEDVAVALEKTKFVRDSRRSGIRAVGAGEVGGWRNRLTHAQNQKFRAFAEGMERVGYPQE